MTRPNIHISFILPAYNEEAYLKKSIDAIRFCSKKLSLIHEIIVVDNNSNDNTYLLAKKYADHVIKEPIQKIARARNTGAKHANYKNLVFIDSDTLLNMELLKETILSIQDETIIAGGTTIKFNKKSPLVSFWNTISKNFNWAAGCYIFCKKEYFQLSEGFNEAVYASEEIWFFKRIKKIAKRKNKKVRILSGHSIETSDRKFEWFSTSAIALQILLFALFPFLCRYKFFCFLWYLRPKTNNSQNSFSMHP